MSRKADRAAKDEVRVSRALSIACWLRQNQGVVIDSLGLSGVRTLLDGDPDGWFLPIVSRVSRAPVSRKSLAA